jgi:DNA-binding LacI/PurR family transcriptional regulator
MTKNVTIKQIAEMAGVNASTVSRVLNPNCGYSISEKIKKKVLNIADKYEYASRDAARSLVHNKTFVLGVILGSFELDICSPFFSLLLGGFCRETTRNGYKMIILPIEGDNIDDQVLKCIRGGNADGYMVGPGMMGSKTITELEKKRVPVVSYAADNKTSKELNNICLHAIDNKPAFSDMFKTIKERGFDKFLFFKSSLLNNLSRTKLLMESSTYGIEMTDCIDFKGSIKELLARNEARVFVNKNIDYFKQHELIICSNDLMALGVYDALNEAGIKIGKEISIIGYDNIEENLNFQISGKSFISTITIDEQLTGKMMAQKLLKKLQTKEFKGEKVKIPAKFIVRESLGWKSKNDKQINKGINK